MKSYSLWLCAVLVLCAGGTATAHAQVITGGELERGLRWPGPAHDGEAYTARYSYGLGSTMVYMNGDSRRLRYLDYLNRADRAEKFGYPMPIDPYFEAPPPVQVAPPGRVVVGGGFGFWRRR